MENEYNKDFDTWNNRKKILESNRLLVDFHEREIWWCAIGINIGSEQQSDSGDFGRPIVVIRKFTQDIFLAIPLTSKIRDDTNFRVRFNFEEKESDLLVLQMRTYDRKRLMRKIGVMPKIDFDALINYVKQVL